MSDSIFDKELAKCPIKTLETIHDLVATRDYYFNVIDKFNLGYTRVNMCLPLSKDSSLMVSCDKTTIYTLKFITKFDNDEELCGDYNKYCYFNDFDTFKEFYNKFQENGTCSSLESWNQGNEDDELRYNHHIKSRNIKNVLLC